MTGTSSTITTGLAENALYYVRVLAFNTDGDGAWSSTDSATTRIATTSANCPAPTLTGRAQIWSATVSLETGRVNDGLVPYIGFNTVTPHDVFGALSNMSFQVGTNSYTVRTLATIPTIDDALFLSLDRHVTDTEKAELTLHVCDDAVALSSATQVDAAGFKAYQWAYGVDWSASGTGSTSATVIVNTPPTATDGSVTTDEDAAHTFEADDFNFSDTDSGDTLSLVEVVTLPLAGTLTLDGNAVTTTQDVTESDIDADKLVFTPAANANGTGYASFTFKVSDGTDKSALAYTMTVNVTAVNDAVTGLPTISGTARVGATLTAATTDIADADGLPASFSYQWVRVDSGTDTDISGATSSTYTLVGDDEGNTVKVEVSFTDDAGNSEGPLTSAATGEVTPPANTAPAFPNATLTREVAENTVADANVGDVIPEATDADVGATLEYSMEGADEASFAFDVSTRQISTKAALDHETKASYSVTIRVDDANGGTDTVEVTIAVTDLDEQAPPPDNPQVSTGDGSGNSLTVSWRRPDSNGGPAIIGYEVRYGASGNPGAVQGYVRGRAASRLPGAARASCC